MMRRFVLTSSSPSPFLPIASPSSPNLAAAAAKSFPILSSVTQRTFSTAKPNFSPDHVSSVGGTHDDGGRTWGRETASAFSSKKNQSPQRTNANAEAADAAPFGGSFPKPTAATSNDALRAPTGASQEQLGYDHARQPSRDFWLEMSSSSAADTLPFGGRNVAVPSHRQQQAKGRGPTAIRHSVASSSQPAEPYDDFEAVVASSGIIMDGQGIVGSRGGGTSSDIQLGIARRFLSGSAASISNAAMAGSTRKFATSAAVNARLGFGTAHLKDGPQKESPPIPQCGRQSGRKEFSSPDGDSDTKTPVSVSKRLSQWSMRTTDEILPRVSAKGVEIWLL